MINSRDINDLRPDVKENAVAVLRDCAAAGLNVLVTCTLRDDEYQKTLYEQGRTKPGQIVTNGKTTTFHGAGLAFDFCKNVKGHEYDDATFFIQVADIAKRYGFSWGGDWKSFPDRPHIQWDENGKRNGTEARNGKVGPMPKKEDKKVYTKIEQIPAWYKPTIEKLIAKGYLNNLNLSEDMCRIFTVLDRAGVFDNGKN